MLQFRNIIAVILGTWIAGTLGWLAAWGLLPGLDIQQVSSELAGLIATIIITSVSAAVTAYLNRSKAVISDVAAKPEVTEIIVTDKNLAEAIPSEKVVSE